jgi:hypothetical protein
MKTILTFSILALSLGHATANYADSPNVRVDTRGGNLVALRILPATQAEAILAGDIQVMSDPTNTVAMGQTLQFSVLADLDTGFTEDVTSHVVWGLGGESPEGLIIQQNGILDATSVRVSVSTPSSLIATYGVGTKLLKSSSPVVILPGLNARIAFDVVEQYDNGPWVLLATAMVSGNSTQVNPVDIQWDWGDSDGLFNNGSGFDIEKPIARGFHLLRVQVQLNDETATDAVLFGVSMAPNGYPLVSNEIGAFSESLQQRSGNSMNPLATLPDSISKLAVVIHGMGNDSGTPWVGTLCDAIEGSGTGATVVAYDWKMMADVGKMAWNKTVLDDRLLDVQGGDWLRDLYRLRENGRVNGMMLAERLIREELLEKITKNTPIHLIGHSAGGFVAGECALRLEKAGFSELQVTMLDTPIPYKQHVNSVWRTERYIGGWLGGRFETEIGKYDTAAGLYNEVANLKGDKIETIIMDTSPFSNIFVFYRSKPTTFSIKSASGIVRGESYRRHEIQHANLPDGPIARHGFAHEWYEWTVSGGVSGDGFYYSNLQPSPRDFPPPPSYGGGIAVASADDESPIQPMSEPPLPVDLDGFTYFGQASGSGGVHTLSDQTDAGLEKTFTLPIGSQTLRFRYQFTTAGDGDFLAAYWGEESVLVICPDTDSARAGFVEMETDVSRFGGQQGNLVFKLVSRGEVNAVAQIDQVQIVLSEDPDDDGLTNDQEATYGSNPHRDDTDGDGLYDYDEVTNYGTDPTKADTDGDMVPDAAELAASTNPLDKNFFLRPRMERGTSGQPELRWQGVNGRTYSVVRSLDLSGTAFDFIRTEVPGAGVDCSVSDPDTSVNPRAFYWVLPE